MQPAVNTSWVDFYSTDQMVEQLAITALLDDAGIPYWIKQTSALRHLQEGGMSVIFVPADCLNDALALYQDWKTLHPESIPFQCPACQEYNLYNETVCPSCGLMLA
jgi:hypothetical protein